ncbi:hypothetical protein SpCBS45565_g05047 [Spizellomyces sp. 'palustris']|nr:hypothetical protein SpCBS45565_g05047 [Spizellomyces sp. 'palustris']
MIRDWDELSEEWQEATDALPAETYPTGPFSGSQNAEDTPGDGHAKLSTVRVFGDQQKHSGISANSRPWERSQLKDMFSPLSLERLFKAPVGSLPDSTPSKGMASLHEAVSERWADQSFSEPTHSIAIMQEETNGLHIPEEKRYPLKEPLVHWDHQIPAHAFAELSLFVDPDVHPKTQLADLTGLDVSASRIEGNQDISLSLGERSYRDRGGAPSSEGTPKKHHQHVAYWGNGSIRVSQVSQVPKRTEWPEAHKKAMLPRNSLGDHSDDPPRRPSTGRDTTLSNTSWPDGADLFQVDYDTKTRSYLDALVDELRSSKQQPQNQRRHDGGDAGTNQTTSANIQVRPIASTTHYLIPSHDSQLEPSVSTHLNHKSYTVNNAPYHSDEGETNETIDIPPSAEPASANDCPRNVSMPADLQSYPSDIDFLEDVFENSIRNSHSRGTAQNSAASVEIDEQTGNHSSSPNKSSTKSESGRSSQSKILTIRNLNSAKNKSSVILSHLGASSQMRFNEDKQRWEENDGLMEEIPRSVAEGTPQASVAQQEPAEQCVTGTGPLPANFEQEAQYLYGSPDSGDIRSLAGCSDATVQGTETQPEIATTLSRQPGDRLQREPHEELHRIRSPTSVRSQRMVLDDLHTPAETGRTEPVVLWMRQPKLFTDVGVFLEGSRFQSDPERREESGEPDASNGMLPNLAKALKLQADWMTMTHLDLSRYGIGSVHSLKRHAPQVRTLKVNDNKLPYLNGVPDTVAVLHAQNNLLSNITTFAHLPALQFLDISGNMVDDLSGLTCLPNLRELHAYERIFVGTKSLELTLNPMGRKFQHVIRLQDSISGIERLVCLRELILDQNKLGSLTLRGELSNMEVLSLNDNELQTFDGRHWPNLRRLSLDRNRIQHFSHEKYLSHLQSLSIERQSVPVLMIKFSHLRRLTDLRISGNSFQDLRALRHNIRLQFLEAQATGISHIPEDFARNLRDLAHLNLSDNEISEIQTVRHLKSLRSLIMTGNVIEDFAMISEALKGLTRVEVLDFRHNPVTARFYAQRTTPLDESQWLTSDELFRKQLNDADFVRRTCYRSSLISILRGSLRSLDNIATGEPDKKVAKYQMSRLKSSLRRSMSSVTMGD